MTSLPRLAGVLYLTDVWLTYYNIVEFSVFVMWRIWVGVAVAYLSAFQVGLSVVMVNTMLETVAEDLRFDEDVGGAVASSALFLGAICGSLFVGIFQKICGKYSQLWTGALYGTGNLLCAVTTDSKLCWEGAFDGCVPIMILVGRLLAGIAVGLSFVIAPRYMAEIAPPHIRGALISGVQLSGTIGAFTGLAIGLPYDFDSFDAGFDWWRVMFWFAVTLAITQCLLWFLTLPLYNLSQEELRKTISSKKSMNMPIEQDIEMIDQRPDGESHDPDTPAVIVADPATTACTSTDQTDDTNHEKRNLLKSFSVLLEKRYRHCVILAVGTPAMCNLSGINVVLSYSATILEDAGFEKAIAGSIVLGFGLVTATVVSILFYDRVGRVTVSYLSFSGMSITLLALALSDLADSTISGPLSVVFVVGFVVFFGFGVGSLNLGYGPEVTPPEVAGIVLGTGQAVGFLVTIILVLVFPGVLDGLGVFVSFLILAAFSAFGIVFTKLCMVETNGRELEEIVAQLTRVG